MPCGLANLPLPATLEIPCSPPRLALEPQLATERPLQEGHEPICVSHLRKSTDVQWPDVPLLEIQQDVWYASVRSLGGRVSITRLIEYFKLAEYLKYSTYR